MPKKSQAQLHSQSKITLEKTSDVLKKAEQIIEDHKKFTEGPALKLHDIYLPLNHLFNAAAKRAFTRQVKDLRPIRDLVFFSDLQTKVQDTVKYFGAQVRGERKIFDAAQKVANHVNFYADKGFITGYLTKLMLCPLVSEPHQLERFVVVSYVAFSPEGLKFLEANPCPIEFKEGGLPEEE